MSVVQFGVCKPLGVTRAKQRGCGRVVVWRW